jgi:hypothetical protein
MDIQRAMAIYTVILKGSLKLIENGDKKDDSKIQEVNLSRLFFTD